MEALTSLGESIQGAAGTVMDTVSDSFAGFQREIDERRAQFKELLESWLKEKFEDHAERLIDRIPAIIKDNLEDPYMPRFVRKGLFRAVDKTWPDFRQEIIYEMLVLIDGDEKAYEQKLDDTPPPCCLRGWMRYHLFPCDRGIWYTLRDPFFILINFLTIVPYFGIYAFTFAFIFLLIDKRDEYQLVNFILSFKGAQFFSWGLVKGIVGFTMYFMCVTFPDISVTDLSLQNLANNTLSVAQRTSHKCEDYGPGKSDSYMIAIISWLLPLALVWVSLLLLPCSKEKGRVELEELEDRSTAPSSEEEKKRKQAAGGYIRYMLMYDLCVFCICLGLMMLIVYSQPNPESGSKWEKAFNAKESDWQVQQTLYFCQFLYGLFSFVFVPFKIPFLQAVLTHSVPTAYDKQGRCCKFKGPEKPPKEEFEGEKAKPQEILNDEEHDGLMANFKTIAMGGSVDLEGVRKRKRRRTQEAEAEAAAPDGAA